eukprot:GHRR01008843.1.p1 GENE.GHRR01008843.1~~GHRR01008843.1.p1  ORF type:complete len:313 (+),score=32.93 GHRR01008843.1:184-1122(+)
MLLQRSQDRMVGQVDWNRGVPGDWVTGNRMLDVTMLPLVFAIAFPILRSILQKLIYEPTGRAVLTRQQKKQDITYTDAELTGKMIKWNESCWKMTVYTVFTTVGFLVAFPEPYFLDPYFFWTDANQFPLNYHVPLKTVLFYLVQIGFYIQAIPFLMFIEVRRKDWMESFSHHIVTLGLMYYSWYANFTRTGVIVMLLHDISDIFLEAAKLARYAKRDNLARNLFIVFALSWVILRVIIYPYIIVLRILVDPVVYIAIPYNINPQPHYAAFGTMFTLLYFLHLYWTYLIIKIIWKQLRTGKTDDIREEDSDDD